VSAVRGVRYQDCQTEVFFFCHFSGTLVERTNDGFRESHPSANFPVARHAPMGAYPSTRERARWSVDRAVSLHEVWALVAAFSGLVGAWRLTGVCRAARAGAKEWLGTLPGMVLCGGYSLGGRHGEVWKLSLATLRWVPMPALVIARDDHACCAVRGALVVLGGSTDLGATSSVEMLSEGRGAPPIVMRRDLWRICHRCRGER
jgi:hypothetical protein